MDGEWYCSIGGKEIGPLLPQQLRAMAESGGILPTDRVRRGATGSWLRASQVKGLFAVPSPPSPPGPEVSAGNGPLDGNVLTSLDPAAHRGSEGSALPTYARRQRQQQQRLIGSLVVVGIGVLMAVLILIFGHGGDTGHDKAVTEQRKPANESKSVLGTEQASQLDKVPAPEQEPSKESTGKNSKAQTKKGTGGEKAKHVETEPLRPPSGKPEEDFGIRPDEVLPQVPHPPSVKKPS